MRKFLFFSVLFGFGFFGAMAVNAAEPVKSASVPGFQSPGYDQPLDQSLEVGAGELAMIDLMAADFFENSLRRAQSLNIEAQTSVIYRNLSKQERERFRAGRMEIWRGLTDEQRLALRGVKTPTYLSLSETQKAPFRKIAHDRLTGPHKLNPTLSEASPVNLGNEI